LAVILVTGFFLRIFYLCELHEAPDFKAPAVDAGFYDYWARSIVIENFQPPQEFGEPEISRHPYFMPPGYPYFLSGLYFLLNVNSAHPAGGYLAARLAQMLLGLFNCFIGYLLARRLFNRSVGLIFAALMSVYWIFIYFEGQLNEPVLLVFLILLAVYVLVLWTERFNFAYGILAGILLGLAGLVRPNALLFVPLAAVWMLWNGSGNSGRARIIFSVLVFLAGAAAAIAPVTVRNYLVAKQPVLISSNAGVNLYIGNNPKADGFFVTGLEELESFNNCYDYPQIVRDLQRKSGTSLNYSQVSRYFTGKALRFIKENPLKFLTLLFRKTLLFWGPAEISSNKVIHYEKQNSALLRYLPGFSAVFSLSIVGIILLFFGGSDIDKSAKATRPLVLILAFIGVYFASHLPFFITARYRVPVIPFLLMFGAWGLYRLGRFVWIKDFRNTGLWLAVWLVLYLVVSRPIIAYEPPLAGWHLNRAVSYRRIGQLQPAIEESRKALQLNPNYVDARCHLAMLLAMDQKEDQAVEQYEKALQIDAGNYKVHNDLGVLQANQGQLDEAIEHFKQAVRIYPEYADAYYNLGKALLQQDKIDEAGFTFERFLRLRPGRFELCNEVALVFYEKGRLDKTIDYWKRSIQIEPYQPNILFNLAFVLDRNGEFDEAVQYYNKALQIRPDHYQGHNNFASLLARQGRMQLAIEHWKVSLGLMSKQHIVHYNLGKALARRGKGKEAVSHFRDALWLKPDWPYALSELAWVLATYPDEELRDTKEALRLAKKACELTEYKNVRMLDSLAAAYAASGDFPEAVRFARQAFDLAVANGEQNKARQISNRLGLYQDGICYYDSVKIQPDGR